MGIRVVCPNGHQLNVKTFLAGKKGICPHCQSRFDIPAGQSTTETHTGPAPAEAEAPQPQPNPARPKFLVDESTVVVREPADRTPDPEAVTPRTPFQSPDLSQPPAAKTEQVSPVTEPAQWYVRPPAGGQYGPATDEMMEQWIGDGRVPETALVWRTGWTDWARADSVADRLPGRKRPITTSAVGSGESQSVSVDLLAVPSLGGPAADNPASPAQTAANRLRRKRKAAAKAQAWIAGLLLVAAIILGALLVIVLRGSSDEQTPTNDTTTESPPS